MPENWIGIVAARHEVVAVRVEVPDDDDAPLVILEDCGWPLQKGDRAAAYRVLHQQVLNYCQEHGVVRAIVKESAVNPRARMTKGNLESAEVRGVVIAAASAIANTEVVAKATVSKTFGTRKADEYLKDDDFWEDHVEGDLRIGSREAVLVLLFTRSSE